MSPTLQHDRQEGWGVIDRNAQLHNMCHGQELGEFSHIDGQSYQHFIENYPRENSWLVVWNRFFAYIIIYIGNNKYQII